MMTMMPQSQIAIVLCGLLLVTAAPAADITLATENTLPHVTVFGTATTEVTPDQMVWHLTLKTQGDGMN